MKPRFKAFLFLGIIIFLASCRRDVQDRPGGPSGSADSLSVLTATGGGQFGYPTNDTLPDKLFTVNSSPNTGGGYWQDTSYIFYTADRKVSRLMTIATTTSSQPEKIKTWHLAIYDQGRVVKIYMKRTVTENEPEFYDPSFGQSVGPITPWYNIQAYDSIIYDSRGRVIRNYHFEAEQLPNLAYVFTLRYNDILDYFNPTTQSDNLLYSAKRISSVTPQYLIYFKEYDTDKVNPLYRTFKELAFFQRILHIRKYYVAQFTSDGGLQRYVTLNPYPLKKLYAIETGNSLFGDYLFQNTYDANGYLISSSYNTIYNPGGVLGYNYLRRKK